MKINSKGMVIISLTLIVVLFVSAFIINLNNTGQVSNDDNNFEDSIIVTNEENNTIQLPNVESKKKFLALLKEGQEIQNKLLVRNAWGLEELDTEAENTTADSNFSAETVEKSDYSGTNNQVEGVDEGDIIKTDGQYIYKVGDYSEVLIIDANPQNPEVISRIRMDDNNGINQLFLADNNLIIVANYYSDVVEPILYESEKTDRVGSEEELMCMPYGGEQESKVLIYDIIDKERPKLEKEYIFDGYFVSGRTIDSYLYFVTNKHMYYDWYTILEEEYDINDEAVLPSYKDCTLDKEITMDYKDIQYFPNYVEPSYMITVSMDLNNLQKAPDVQSYLGSSGTIYVSHNSLYTAITSYIYKEQNKRDDFEYKVNTEVYRFNLDKGKMISATNQTVPGAIVNQFSMDEFDNHFRIATTTGIVWDDNNPSENNLYILDDTMEIVGKVEGLAEGEKIYSTRFMGEKVYMVTFKQVDPLFVIDTSTPTKPEVLGYLKIPGVSEYLHPIDDTHLLGFGRDAKEEDWGTTLTGFKISLFDVSNPDNPIESQSEIIGGSGTYSEMLSNHKAFMYSDSKEIMAFPIEITDNEYNIKFNGALVYDVNAQGFSQKGQINHFDEKAKGEDYYNWEKTISRVIYIGDYLYSISQDKILVHDIETMMLVGEADL